MKINYHNSTKALGPYSSAVEVILDTNRTLYVSGQGTIDQATGQKYLGDIKKQAFIALSNMKEVIERSGFSMTDVIKITIYLTNIEEFNVVNVVYSQFFIKDKYPARTTIEVSALPGGHSISIDAIAIKK